MNAYPSRRAELWAGIKDTFPLVVGAIPFGMIFGAAGVASGLSPEATQGMSLFVFAGSAQFIATRLIASGVPPLVIILTTFVVNLRHALYSATLAPHMKRLPQRWLAPLGFWLTDESFVVVIRRYTQPDPSPYKHWYFLGSALSMYVNWQLATFIGIVAGQRIENPAAWGLDFAMIATFIGMIVPLARSRAVLVSIVVAGLSSTLAYPLPNRVGLILAALLGVTAGLLAEARFPQPQRPPEAETAA